MAVGVGIFRKSPAADAGITEYFIFSPALLTAAVRRASFSPDRAGAAAMKGMPQEDGGCTCRRNLLS